MGCFDGFGLFSLLEYGVVKAIDKIDSNIGCSEDRRRAIEKGKRYYFDTKLCCHVDIKTGHKCNTIFEYSKYGNGYYLDLVTGEKLDYFGDPHPNYVDPKVSMEQHLREAKELLAKYRAEKEIKNEGDNE